MQEKTENNIDKDIEILKEMQKEGLQLVRVYKMKRDYYKAKKVKQKAQAIENVLKRLKEYEEHAIFICDPEKNKECSKTNCYINNGPCNQTTNIKYRIDK